MRTLVGLALAGGAAVALATAPTSAAAPDCTDVGPSITFCQTNGSTQLSSKPPPMSYNGWSGVGVWPLVGPFGIGSW
ncbi:hypothetical protein [Mycobacterium sp. SMC-4]|uniref:hypothetical protein n=1 Tax=Mycobacterium sp. SMC-4 TaxID=2857059 RepID=UPI0021B22863|nr:hypothetical protein [Mycobacterium sp. SMC-4]UXA17242.1 hypothetical protein KXD98_21235 [Mycobacterium sp. SMC-4]